MKVAFKKSTQEVINDFQSNATSEVLIANAIKSGVDESDIEIRELSEEDYYALEEQVNGPARELLNERDAQLVANAEAIKQKLGLTDDEVKALAVLLNSK